MASESDGEQSSMKHVNHTADLCVVGGGLSGMCAAIAAARGGAKVVLMHDRPVLGGNASSEVRMWICGAHGPSMRETGILEEIELDNIYYNRSVSYAVWNAVLYGKVRFEPNITLLLNCSCNQATMDGPRIESVTGWQGTAETWHTVSATLFADCSGDSILAPLTGAEYRVGREAQGEFDEDIEPEQADSKTMGMSCLIQSREADEPQPFIPFPWANTYDTCDDLPNRGHDPRSTNYWWIELGGEHDSIHDTEMLRDELLKVSYGLWDHIKNRCVADADNLALDWVGFLPGKRESRRYVGDHILTQNDVRNEGRFEDVVAYGGWSMDDHHPGGMNWPGAPTIFHPAPSPYGIPYRCLYSRNIENLLFAGRNISVTHAAMSSTRVMATCSILGQAMGAAAALAIRDGLSPRGVYDSRRAQLQQTLMEDDCYLPWAARRVPAIMGSAKLSASEGDPEPLRNGIDRPVGDTSHAWTGHVGAWAQCEFASRQNLAQARIVFDSDLDRKGKNMPAMFPKDPAGVSVPAACALLDGAPPTMTRAFHIEALDPSGAWQTVAREENNFQRLVRVDLGVTTTAVRLVLDATWGSQTPRVFSWDVR